MIQILQSHIVKGLVLGNDLEDDLVGSAISGAKLRSNIYHTENDNWKEIVVSFHFFPYFTLVN